MLYCVIDSKVATVAQLVERSLRLQSVGGFESYTGSSSFFLWVYIIDLFGVPLPFYLVVFTCII